VSVVNKLVSTPATTHHILAFSGTIQGGSWRCRHIINNQTFINLIYGPFLSFTAV